MICEPAVSQDLRPNFENFQTKFRKYYCQKKTVNLHYLIYIMSVQTTIALNIVYHKFMTSFSDFPNDQ